MKRFWIFDFGFWIKINRPVGTFCLALIAFLFALGLPVQAQQRGEKPLRIGYLGNSASAEARDLRRFRERLNELGYNDNQNVTIEEKYWEGKVERLPEIATDLVRLNCDVIVTAGTEAGNAARNATNTIPVVLAFGVDAIRLGFVKDLARPQGNITGLTSIGTELYGKRLELLKEVIPRVSRVAFLWSPTSPGADVTVKAIQDLANVLMLEIQSLEVKRVEDIAASFRSATKTRVQAMLMGTGGFFAYHQKRIIDLASNSRLPTMHSNIRFVEAGGLMSYAYDRPYNYRRAAEYVDKILKGARPSELPLERPKKFELAINLKAAQQIGLTIPPNVLARADKVVR